MNIENFDKMTDFQQWVICTMASDEGFKNKTDEYHTMSLTFNGVEENFLEWCNRLEFAIDEKVIEKSRDLAIENFGDMMNLCSEFLEELDEMQKDLVTKIRHKLELPTWEERFGE